MKKAGALWTWLGVIYPLISFGTFLNSLTQYFDWPLTWYPLATAVMWSAWIYAGMKIVPEAVGKDIG